MKESMCFVEEKKTDNLRLDLSVFGSKSRSRVSIMKSFSFIPDFPLKSLLNLSPSYILQNIHVSVLNNVVSNSTAVFTLYFTVGSFHYFGSSNTVTTILKKISYTTQQTH